MEEKDYIIIPQKILEDDTLTSTDKLVYGIILRLTRCNGYCWATNQYIADILHINSRTVSTCIRKLREQNYIKSSRNKNDKFKTFRKISFELEEENIYWIWKKPSIIYRCRHPPNIECNIE